MQPGSFLRQFEKRKRRYGRPLAAPTGEQDILRYHCRGDHWSPAHTRKPPPDGSGGFCRRQMPEKWIFLEYRQSLSQPLQSPGDGVSGGQWPPLQRRGRLPPNDLYTKKRGKRLLSSLLCWRLPIFPDRCQSSIFGTSELNFRVRNGNGWTLTVRNTNYCYHKLSISQLTVHCNPI